jgi:YfiH family protein
VTLDLLRSPLLDGVPGIVHAFTTRKGGASRGPLASLNLSPRVGDTREALEENRSRLLTELGRPDAVFVLVKQMHGGDVVEVTRFASRSIQADGVWTRDRAALLAVLVADCVPILLASKDGKAVAAVHAGWRGTQARIAARAVERLVAGGFPAANLIAAIGPAIGPCCFEIGADVEAALRLAFPTAGDAIRAAPEGKRVADLWALNRMALVDAGVPAASIDVLTTCVSCDAERFYSHRRDKGETGRQAGVIGFKSR